MRIRTALIAACAFAFATSASAELQLINNGPMNAKEAQDAFQKAWTECSKEVPGASQTVFYACINKKIAKHKLQAIVK